MHPGEVKYLVCDGQLARKVVRLYTLKRHGWLTDKSVWCICGLAAAAAAANAPAAIDSGIIIMIILYKIDIIHFTGKMAYVDASVALCSSHLTFAISNDT